MLDLTALQELYTRLTLDAKAAVDNDEARLLREAAGVVSNMISIRLDRGETGYDGWSSTTMGGMYINGDVSIEYRQIVINSPLGHIGTGRYELQLGSGTILKTDDTRMLAATPIPPQPLWPSRSGSRFATSISRSSNRISSPCLSTSKRL